MKSSRNAISYQLLVLLLLTSSAGVAQDEPWIDSILLTTDAQDLASCKKLGQIKVKLPKGNAATEQDLLNQIRRQAWSTGADTVLITHDQPSEKFRYVGVSYRCIEVMILTDEDAINNCKFVGAVDFRLSPMSTNPSDRVRLRESYVMRVLKQLAVKQGGNALRVLRIASDGGNAESYRCDSFNAAGKTIGRDNE